MSRDGTLPPGVEHSDPHFNPPDSDGREHACNNDDCDGPRWFVDSYVEVEEDEDGPHEIWLPTDEAETNCPACGEQGYEV